MTEKWKGLEKHKNHRPHWVAKELPEVGVNSEG